MKTIYQFKALIQTRLMTVERYFWMPSRDCGAALRKALSERLPDADVHVNFVRLDHVLSDAECAREIAHEIVECDRIAVGGDR